MTSDELNSILASGEDSQHQFKRDVHNADALAAVRRPLHELKESQPESQPESLSERVVAVLLKGPLGKAEIAAALGMRAISAHLNQVIRGLLAERRIAMTLPEKPNSRLQKYRLGTGERP